MRGQHHHNRDSIVRKWLTLAEYTSYKHGRSGSGNIEKTPSSGPEAALFVQLVMRVVSRFALGKSSSFSRMHVHAQDLP